MCEHQCQTFVSSIENILKQLLDAKNKCNKCMLSMFAGALNDQIATIGHRTHNCEEYYEGRPMDKPI